MRGRKAWGEAGTVISGQPLAIEYNQAVLEDKPHQLTDTPEDVIDTENIKSSSRRPSKRED